MCEETRLAAQHGLVPLQQLGTEAVVVHRASVARDVALAGGHRPVQRLDGEVERDGQPPPVRRLRYPAVPLPAADRPPGGLWMLTVVRRHVAKPQRQLVLGEGLPFADLANEALVPFPWVAGRG
jgi:hypothetical protein